MRAAIVAFVVFASWAVPTLVPGRAEEDAEQRAILALIAPRRGEVIADVGCGEGAWTFVLARAVGSSGAVLAVDIDPDAIAAVKRRAEEEGVENVSAIRSVSDDPMLPEGALDAIFMNNVIDWVERPALAGFLEGIRRALKPDGRLVIRDPSGGPDRVIAELYRAGFTLVEAKIPLESAPNPSFATGWYALKLRRGEPQPAVLPRLGRPARYRFRLHLAEEMFRAGLLTREELRARWEAIRDRPGEYDPARDELRDLVRAAEALDVVESAEAAALLERVGAGR